MTRYKNVITIAYTNGAYKESVLSYTKTEKIKDAQVSKVEVIYDWVCGCYFTIFILAT